MNDSLNKGRHCPSLFITLTNGPKTSHGTLEGSYKLSNIVNGRPSWTSISTSKGIWYSQESNLWMLGNLEDLGETMGYIYTINEYGGPDNITNVWNYWDGNSWVTAGSNDINFECKGR